MLVLATAVQALVIFVLVDLTVTDIGASREIGGLLLVILASIAWLVGSR